jgi:hypothetical protein
MTADPFTDPDDPDEDWIDVRMTDPEEGEWDVDVIVAGGRVEYVDLRIRPALLTAFVDCLVDDASDERTESVLSTLAERNGIDLAAAADDANGGEADGRDD